MKTANPKPTRSASPGPTNSQSACNLQCFADKSCKMFVLAENICSIYAEEMEHVTFQDHAGAKVYYKNN